MPSATFLTQLLMVIGCGFLVANLRLLFQFLRYRRLRATAVLIWPGRRPPYFGLLLALGVILGFLLFYKVVVQGRPPVQVFGEGMMFVYYAYALPLSLRIGRGFYRDGIWTDTGFLPYAKIGGLSWRESEEITLIVIHRVGQLARRLVVPQACYGAARRLLRDKIAARDIPLEAGALDLGAHDHRDDV